jgi:rhodanese-related sulfurtransferase
LFPYDSTSTTTATTAQNCNDHGVWGPVPGLIGTVAAMECLKVIGGFGQPLYHHTLVYEADTAEAQRWKKPSHSRKQCLLCGVSPTIRSLRDTKENLQGLLSCNNNSGSSSDNSSSANDDTEMIPQVSVVDYHQVVRTRRPHVLLDVRNSAQFALVHLPNAVHLPLSELLQLSSSSSSASSSSLLPPSLPAERPVYVLCRRGIASATAVRHLRQILPVDQRDDIYHIQGGLDAWRTNVDPSFPKY